MDSDADPRASVDRHWRSRLSRLTAGGKHLLGQAPQDRLGVVGSQHLQSGARTRMDVHPKPVRRATLAVVETGRSTETRGPT